MKNSLKSLDWREIAPRVAADLVMVHMAAIVALAAGLAGYVMVKFFGIVFLGQPREPWLAVAHDVMGLAPVERTITAEPAAPGVHRS